VTETRTVDTTLCAGDCRASWTLPVRRRADADSIRAFLHELGPLAIGPTTIFLVGGATAVLYGWRSTTIDIDLRIEPERDELLRALPDLKERLSTNVELASPLDFLPELPGWRDRSPFVAQEGDVTVRHFDLYAQALAKLERGFDQDLSDVEAMLARGLVDVTELQRLFDAVEAALYRFPAVDPASLRRAVHGLRRPDGDRSRPDHAEGT
jgi:hypothetical protein